jgi:glyceraldehyde 3-phosphate dehydrogenase
MTHRIAINGFGRIGRSYLRCLLERGMLGNEVAVVAINDLWDPATLAHLLAYDSTMGKARFDVSHDDASITVDGTRIPVFGERDAVRLPWAKCNVDLVIEATGRLRTRDDASKHIKAGAQRVLLTAPGKDVDATLVVGINEHEYDPIVHQILSAASCTTNCAAPMVSVLHNAFGVVHGYLTTVHAYTNDQVLLDSPHKDPRRGRAAAVNIIPTSTGAARAIGVVLPELAGRLDGIALRVPVADASLCDLTAELAEPATAGQINAAFATAAGAGRLSSALRYSEDPLVSSDIIGDPSSCVFDAKLTQSGGGHLVKIFGWYDNEWGYTNRLVDLSALIAANGP